MVDAILNREILDVAVDLWAKSPFSKTMVLRGSYVMPFWSSRCFRSANDLDFASLGSFDPDKAFDMLCSALLDEDHDDKLSNVKFLVQQATWEVIFEETNFPGIRVFLPVLKDGYSKGNLQIDIGFDDPIPCGPLETKSRFNDQTTFLIPRPETAFGWKLHGVVEREGFSWRAKDVGDLWLIATTIKLDLEKLRESILVSFRSRDAPLWRLDRLLFGNFGRSSESRRGWRRLLRDHPEANFPTDHNVCVELIRETVKGVLPDLVPGTAPIWPVNLKRSEFDSSVEESKHFRSFVWGERDSEIGTVFVCERTGKKTCPEPIRAETETEFRRRQIRREARGVTFSIDGELLARPYAQFGNAEDLSRLSDQAIQELELTVTEKLDGSLVFPTRAGQGSVLRTRRGRSEIADAAEEFAFQSNSDYRGLIDHCLSKKWTPIFEWCSRSRRIVFDHPMDRLVLTGVRELQSGTLLDDQSMRKLGRKFEVEVAARIDFSGDLEELSSRVLKWTTREGCIVRDKFGRQYKLKSDRYVWLHRLVEGPSRERACWSLLAQGAKSQMLEVSSGRNQSVDRYTIAIENSIAQVVELAKSKASRFRGRAGNGRRMLAQEIVNEPNRLRTLAFAAFEEQDVEALAMQMIQQACQSEQTFQSLLKTFAGPRLVDFENLN